MSKAKVKECGGCKSFKPQTNMYLAVILFTEFFHSRFPSRSRYLLAFPIFKTSSCRIMGKSSLIHFSWSLRTLYDFTASNKVVLQNHFSAKTLIPTVCHRVSVFILCWVLLHLICTVLFQTHSVQRDSKRWTQFRTSIFPELYMVCEWST